MVILAIDQSPPLITFGSLSILIFEHVVFFCLWRPRCWSFAFSFCLFESPIALSPLRGHRYGVGDSDEVSRHRGPWWPYQSSFSSLLASLMPTLTIDGHLSPTLTQKKSIQRRQGRWHKVTFFVNSRRIQLTFRIGRPPWSPVARRLLCTFSSRFTFSFGDPRQRRLK
jgi:hypothetical protein